MPERAVFTTANGTTIEGEFGEDGEDIVFLVSGRPRRPVDLPPGRLVLTVPHRTLRAAALVQRAMRAGFDARLTCEEAMHRHSVRRW